jgi:lipopolysaccharide assembly outer membrane protein LptD (OstA)
MRKILLFVILLSIIGFVNGNENEKTAVDNNGTTEKPSIYATAFKSNENSIIYIGNVEVKFGAYRIYADYVEYIENRTVKTKGLVTLVSDETVITGRDLFFNLKTKSGTMAENSGVMFPSIRYDTDKLKFIDDKTIKFNKFEFTSCSQRIPRWKITCSAGKIKKEKYVEMKNAVLKIKRVPVFYFPYMRYPIRKGGKATGLLFPNFGTGSKKGFYIQNALFLNFKPNLDLTLYGDYFSKAGFGTGEELRYLFPNMSGNIKFYYFKYKDGNDIKADGNSDYYLDVRHSSDFKFLDT